MGTITTRKLANGEERFLAQITIKQKGKIVHREAQTFERRAVAKAWVDKRERALKASPEALAAATAQPLNPTLSDMIDLYIDTSRKRLGKTKAQVLRAVQGMSIGEVRADKLTSQRLVEFAEEMSKGRQASTVGNYLSHIGAVMTIARPAWGFAVPEKALSDARIVTTRLGLTGRSEERARRPTTTEMTTLLRHHAARPLKAGLLPMAHLTLFAMFSSRRLEEITRILWEDLDREGARILVRDMKNPGQKWGNDVWTRLTPEALEIIDMMPRDDHRIFPHNGQSVSAAHARACATLGIVDLHFHDLRHEAISRLFEMGFTIPQAAEVSGHRSWTSLKRYSHIRHSGDPWTKWDWRALMNEPPPKILHLAARRNATDGRRAHF